MLALIIVLSLAGSVASKPSSDINDKVAQLDIDTAELDDVIRIFGEPEEYIWGNQTFRKDNLPSIYIASYPNNFSVVIHEGKVSELRFEGADAGYAYQNKLRIGSSLDEVIEVIGQPKEVVVAEQNKFEDGVLYKDIDGKKGHCYYGRSDKSVRLFFADYKVAALYVTRSDYRAGRSGSFQTVKPVESVKEFDDVRWKDLSKINLGRNDDLIKTLTFNKETVWPEHPNMPVGLRPDKVLTNAMNPGLGIRVLHQRGITGKGVNVAIIDQPLYLDHPEFAGKIAAYHDVGCGTESSMHGPAVASLLVGTNCGTAPDARVYYVAAPSWTEDTAYQAEALDWIIQQNETLPASEKIRVVSVSASPSGRSSPFKKNKEMWDKACARAEEAGLLVLDCTEHRGFIAPCWYDERAPESIARCKPGFPGIKRFVPGPETIFVPASPRTAAEERDKGDFSYQYYGRGGLSWTIPYCAGVFALGWQIRPDLSPGQMRELLFRSAYTTKDGSRIINPKKFILLVEKAKGHTKK